MRFRNFIKSIFDRKFTKFFLIGIINTFNTALFTHLLDFIMQENIAAIGGYIISLVIAYFLNARFVFKQPYAFKSALRFFATYIPNFLMYNGIIFLLMRYFNFPSFVDAAITVMICGPITFLILKFFAFRDKEKNKE